MNKEEVYNYIETEAIPELSEYNFIDKADLIRWLQTYGDSLEGNTISEKAKIHPTAIVSNSIIESGVEIYEGCTVRNSYIGQGTIVGHGTEIARSIVLRECMIPRFNYVGTTLLGERVRLGGCVMFATRRHDDQDAKILIGKTLFKTNYWKVGSIVGSDTILGYGCHVNPGFVIGNKVIVGALVDVSFSIPARKIVKIRQNLDIFENPN